MLNIRFLQSMLRLTRFWNLLIIIVAQYFTAIFLLDQSSGIFTNLAFFLLCLSTVMIAAGGYIINDYYDVKIDFINKPARVVVSKSIPRRLAIFFHVLLSCVGILIGALLSLKIAIINLFSVFLLWLYSNNLKRQPLVGNLSIALLTGLSIYAVGVFFKTTYTLVIVYAAFSFFMTLIREIVKDMQDLKGDNTFGCKTLPIVWGMRKTKRFIYVLLLVFAGAGMYFNYYYLGWPVYYVIAFLFLPLMLLLVRLIRADTTKDYVWLSNFCKFIMLLGILSMVFI